MTKLLNKSIELAKSIHNPHLQEYNVYAFIYNKNRLLAIGHNDMLNDNNKALYFGNRFNIEQFKKFPKKHAEIDAISKLWGKRTIDGSETLITIRLKKDYSVGNAKPCNNCMVVIDALGITKLEWTK